MNVRVTWLLGLVYIACAGGGSLALDGPREVRVEDLGPVETMPRAVDAQGQSVEATWTAEPADVATVVDGQVVAVGPGKAEVTGQASGGRVSFTLVVDPPLTLVFDDPPASVGVGEQVALEVDATAGGEAVEVADLDWSVVPSDRAAIDGSGTLTGHAPGTVWVTVSDGASEAMLELRVEP